MSYSYIQRKKWQSSGRPRFHVTAPVEVDKEYEAEIEDMSRRGEGIAKIEGFVVFVPNTEQGERVKFKITRVGNRFAIGELAQD
ncbi:TRAM domain-containing protein [Candidatus Bathyarchaeota archaeon]|nr:TRAM domain-containing protein [Candidatus Bathyarchaeota archaeon]MCK5631075.1 TRAM domain-containing protein [Candidatus Bathyarchaeota archaeon]